MRRSSVVEAAILVLLVCGAGLIRTIPLVDVVFAGGTTRYTTTDAWYHVRVAENAYANFPRVLQRDAYLMHPNGAEVPVAPLLPFMIAAIAHLSLGDVENVAAWLPPLLGALTIIPIWALARLLWGRTAALFAAALMATFPGEILHRSLLGHTDHHVLEVILSSVVLLLTIIALRQRTASAALIGGLALALYLLAWTSGVMLVFVVACAAAVAIGVRGFHDAVPARTFTALFGVAAFIVVPFSRSSAAVCGAAAAMSAFALFAARWRRREVFFAVWLGGAAAAAAVVIALHPDYVRQVVLNFHRLMPRFEATLVAEATPVFALARPGRFLLGEFRASGLVALAGLIALAGAALRKRDATDLLLVVWSIAFVLATWRQIRFTYYLAPVVALLCAYAWHLAAAAAPRQRSGTAAMIAAAALLIVPNAVAATAKSRRVQVPSENWIAAMGWLRTETPEPFAAGDLYLAPQSRFAGNRSRWGVLSWWDYGYWITQMAHRVPVTNPTQNRVAEVAGLLLADGTIGSRGARAGEMRYAVLDRGLIVDRPRGRSYVTTSLDPIAKWAGVPAERFYEHFETDAGPLLVFHPDYYRSLVVHLTAFQGAPIVPSQSWVATTVPAGAHHRLVALRAFSNYDAAAQYAAADPRRRIVGMDPLSSCVPLPALPWRRVWSSDGELPEVQIFEIAE